MDEDLGKRLIHGAFGACVGALLGFGWSLTSADGASIVAWVLGSATAFALVAAFGLDRFWEGRGWFWWG